MNQKTTALNATNAAYASTNAAADSSTVPLKIEYRSKAKTKRPTVCTMASMISVRRLITSMRLFLIMAEQFVARMANVYNRLESR